MSDIAMHGSLFIGPHKGYYGRAEYDSSAKTFHGEVVDTKDVITFVAKSGEDLEVAFVESVDDYLDHCASLGETPEKPHSGRLLVRIAPEMHRRLHVLAAISHESINQLVAKAIEDAFPSNQCLPVTHTQAFEFGVFAGNPQLFAWPTTSPGNALYSGTPAVNFASDLLTDVVRLPVGRPITARLLARQ
jgi:predicted HicB family RNase H-like nuclease